MFASATSQTVIGYTRCGDSALWTGHYLAAEAFRYNVTRSPEALELVVRALNGIRSLVDVTGTDLLARCLVPIASPHAAGMMREEAHHGIYTGSIGQLGYFWVGNTSRDQYSGAFFGLAAAYDLVEDAAVRASVRELTGRLLGFLMRNNWVVAMPDGRISTVFWGRSDQQLSFLQVGRRADPERFERTYKSHALAYAWSVMLPISLEVLDDHTSYFKFNLDAINLFNLIRLEDNSLFGRWYTSAYNILRRTTDDHGNAYFNMIDRALKGPDEARDAQTRILLDEWLHRPLRDPFVDLRGVLPACGEDRACAPIPVLQRVRTDFLWQRSPFLLYGGGEGNIETSGIDYILPYWMGRYYGTVE